MKISVDEEVRKILNEYTVELKRAANDAMDEIAKEAVQTLKNTSPKRKSRGKHYANGWAIQRARGDLGINRVQIYNKSKPQLTHLLENGHVIANAYGKYGRFNGIEHIAPVYRWVAEELPERIERKLT